MAGHGFYLSVKGTKQGDFRGQSVKPGRYGWIEITGYFFEGGTRTASTGGGGGKASPERIGSTGGGGGKASVTITKQNDSTSPQLMQVCVTNEVLSKVVLEIVDPSPAGNEIVVSRITLTNAQIRHILPFLRGNGTNSGQDGKLHNFHLTCAAYQQDVVSPHDAASGFLSGKRQH